MNTACSAGRAFHLGLATSGLILCKVIGGRDAAAGALQTLKIPAAIHLINVERVHKLLQTIFIRSTQSTMAKITTLLFDCDNTLVLSETLAFDACASLANRILAKYGVDANYTGEHLLAEFVGRNFRGMLTMLANKHCVKIPADEFESWVAAEEDAVIAQLQEALMPCDGVSGVLERLQETGAYRLAAVSSSALRRVQASLTTVGLDKYFTADAIFSAASSLPIPSSKPDPAIYELALEKLGVTSAECLAVEDSESGVISAHLAGITLVGYTGSYELDEQESMGNMLLKRGAAVIMEDWAQFEGILSQIQEI